MTTVLAKLQQWLQPPELDDPEASRVARLLNLIIWATVVTNIVYSALLPLFAPDFVPLLTFNLALLASETVVLFLLRRKQVWRASKLLCLLFWLYFTAIIAFAGGAAGPAVITYFVLILMAGLLLGGRWVIGVSAISIVAGFILLYLDVNGRLPRSIITLTPLYTWYTAIGGIMIMAVLLYMATNSVRDALQRARESAAALAQKNEDLQRAQAALEARTEELTRAYEGLQRETAERLQAEAALREAQKLESLGLLAGGIAHDFNNLLVAMLAQNSLARAKLPAGTPAGEHLEKASKAAERAADLTRQLLAYTGRGQFQVRPLDLNQLIDDNLHLFEVAVPRHIELVARLADDLPPIEADAGQIQQVIMNLILNGADAIGSQTGALTVTTCPFELHQSNEAWRAGGINYELEPGAYVRLDVSDTGQGMDEATAARIFEPFFTLKSEGRGLGLAAVQGIVRGHNGGLRVTSRPGQGTTFSLLFPARAGSVVPASTDNGQADRRRLAGQVLVIDDEEPVREAVADILEDVGLTVLKASDGLTGVKLFHRHQATVDLVLLDLSMPGMGGAQTLLELRAINPQLKIILSSGYDRAEAMRQVAEDNAISFLQKPYDIDDLLQRVNQYF